jgi:dTDP-4-amino-4,6-dideoxygalactose transaminase
MKLAIHGGPKVRDTLFPAYVTIGPEEKEAVNRVMDSGVLSRYLASWHVNFMGGCEVQALEAEWSAYFKVKHAVAVNSATSGLYCAVGATGIEPGEEIIVSPYTMCATATAPLIFNAVPVFADVEHDHLCLDPASVEERITPRTRAIIVVDLCGQPYDADAINAIARKHNLLVIEDTAQAPGAFHNGRPAGTLGDIGVFSLNYHKHIHCGEGGVIVTDNDELADRCRMIRNHAEAVVEAKGVSNIANMVGFNFRMPELEAAITRCQLSKLEDLVARRQENCAYLAKKLAQIPAVTPPSVRPGTTHAYYMQPFWFDQRRAGVHRDVFIEAVKAELSPFHLREAEGVKIGCGLIRPLYLQPLFQKRIAYGSKGCPFTSPWSDTNVQYGKGLCPTVEKLHEDEVFVTELMQPQLTQSDLDDVANAFFKVWEFRAELK